MLAWTKAQNTNLAKTLINVKARFCEGYGIGFIVDVSGSMGNLTSGMSQFSRLDQAAAMAMLASFKCEDFELVCTAGADHNWTATSTHVKYPIKGFGLINQINETRRIVGQGGIFTRQCLEWCEKHVPGHFDRIIVFSDSQDMDRQNKVPKPYAKHNYIIDVSAHKNGVNFKNVWTAEISGWSENFLVFIEQYER